MRKSFYINLNYVKVFGVKDFTDHEVYLLIEIYTSRLHMK